MAALEDLLKDFLKCLGDERNLSPHTIKNYRLDLKQLLSSLKNMGSLFLQPSRVDRNAARRYLRELERHGYSRRSLARKIASCRSFFKYLAREKEVKMNPFL